MDGLLDYRNGGQAGAVTPSLSRSLKTQGLCHDLPAIKGEMPG
jgi:hypothetical protein